MPHDSLMRTQRQRTKDPKMIGLWRIGRTIGTGSQGKPITLNKLQNVTEHVRKDVYV